MDFLFKLFYVLLVIVFQLQYYTKILLYVQLSGYTIKSIGEYFLLSIKNTFVQWILYLIVFITMLIINYCNIYFLLIMLIFSGVVIILSGDKFLTIRKIKYTKRVCRIILLSVLLFVGYIAITLLFSNIIILVMMPFILPLNFLIMLLSLLILSPIELWIKNSYIRKAKLKLKETRDLIKIGITGSYGKTSTKEILNTILNTSFYTVSTPKSFNTPMGITKTILNDINNLHEVFVCEMGAKKVGEIKELCSLIDVDYGIVTAVGRQHTSTFGSINNIYRTKKELPDYLDGKSCIFNIMNKYVYKMYKEYNGVKIGVFYGKNTDLHNSAFIVKKLHKYAKNRVFIDNKYILYAYPIAGNVYAKNIKIDENGCSFSVYMSGCKLCDASTELIGIHNIINILLAVAMAKLLSVSNENIEIGISKIKQVKARLEKFVSNRGAIILNNGYNSNIDSVDYSLQTMLLFNKSNRLIVTPGLIESNDSYSVNKLFGQKISKYATDVIIVKMINRDAIYSGLMSEGFDMTRVLFVDSFAEAKKYIDALDNSYVVLIENDLPDNYV